MTHRKAVQESSRDLIVEEDIHEDCVYNLRGDPLCALAASPIDVASPEASDLHMVGFPDVIDVVSKTAYEFKTPARSIPCVTRNQLIMHMRMRKIGYDVNVVNDDYVFQKIRVKRRRKIRIRCSCCSRSPLRTVKELALHEKKRRLKLGPAALRRLRLPEFYKAKMPKKTRAAPLLSHNQVAIRSSDDLQKHLVLCINDHHKHIIYVANISRFARDRRKAIARGCDEGQPELLILNPSKEHSGLALSLKPRLSRKDAAYLRKLLAANWKVVRSNDRNTAMRELSEYAECCRRA